MNHDKLITVLRYCPYSHVYCFPDSMMTDYVASKSKALAAVKSMIMENMFRSDGGMLSRIKEHASSSERSHSVKPLSPGP